MAGYPTDATGLYLVDSREQAAIHLLGDDSLNKRMLDSVDVATSPPFAAGVIDGREGGASYNGASGALLTDSAADAASYWKAAHQSTGFTIVLRVEPTGVLNGTVVLTTKTQTASQAGITLFYDGVNQRFSLIVYNGTTAILNLTQTVGVTPPGPHTVVLTYGTGQSPNAVMRVDGVVVATANFTGAAAAGNAGRGLTLGRGYVSAGVLDFFGGLKLVALYPRILSTLEILTWESIAETVQSPRQKLIVRCIGDSITEDTDAYRNQLWRRACMTSNIRLEMVGKFKRANYPTGDIQHDGLSGDTLEDMTIRALVYSGQPVTDYILMGGTNNGAQDVPTMLSKMALAIDACKATMPGARGLVVPIGIGLGNANVPKYLDFNSQLPALVASKGVLFADPYPAPYGYTGSVGVGAFDCSDTVGHPNKQGGDKYGNAIADKMGFQ